MLIYLEKGRSTRSYLIPSPFAPWHVHAPQKTVNCVEHGLMADAIDWMLAWRLAHAPAPSALRSERQGAFTRMTGSVGTGLHTRRRAGGFIRM